ncbi:MAG: YIP1 family protein [Chloroflexi bacterium]|nr:YIP1 family protein [Chloroflexota bacterium]
MEQTPSSPPVSESKPGPAGWLPVWIKAVTQPNEQTFVDITEHPDAIAKTAYIWVFIAGTISGVIQAFATAIRIGTGAPSPFQQIPGLEQYIPQTAGQGGGAGISLISGICASPLAGLLSIVFFALFTAIVQWIAKMFGGTGTYEKLLYALAAITVPFTIGSSFFVLLSAIPYIGICTSVISFGLGIYSLVLQVMAVKGVNRFGWGHAAGSVFIPGCVVFIFCACIVIGGLVLLGPVIGNAFEGVNFAP